jgi:hypothetical protein
VVAVERAEVATFDGCVGVLEEANPTNGSASQGGKVVKVGDSSALHWAEDNNGVADDGRQQRELLGAADPFA